MYVCHCHEGGDSLFVILCVNDITILGSSLDKINDLKKSLSSQCEMTDLGEIQSYLGVNITRDHASCIMEINQTDYIKSIVERFGMIDSNPVYTPLPSGCEAHLVKYEDQASAAEIKQYQQIIGLLLSVQIGSQPEISFTIGCLSQYASNPSKHHYRLAKYVDTLCISLACGISDFTCSLHFLLIYAFLGFQCFLALLALWVYFPTLCHMFHHFPMLHRTHRHFPALLVLWPAFPAPPATFPCSPLVVVPHSLVFQLHTLIPGPFLVYSPCIYTLHLRQVSPDKLSSFPPSHSDLKGLCVALLHIRHHCMHPWLPTHQPGMYPSWAATCRRLPTVWKSV